MVICRIKSSPTDLDTSTETKLKTTNINDWLDFWTPSRGVRVNRSY